MGRFQTGPEEASYRCTDVQCLRLGDAFNNNNKPLEFPLHSAQLWWERDWPPEVRKKLSCVKRTDRVSYWAPKRHHLPNWNEWLKKNLSATVLFITNPFISFWPPCIKQRNFITRCKTKELYRPAEILCKTRSLTASNWRVAWRWAASGRRRRCKTQSISIFHLALRRTKQSWPQDLAKVDEALSGGLGGNTITLNQSMNLFYHHSGRVHVQTSCVKPRFWNLDF